jgi:DNA-directed RNA polymerase specialized sigma subunit
VDDLLKAYEPEVHRRVEELSSGFLSQQTLGVFGRSKALQAFRSWDPSREGAASLKGWVERHVRRIGEDMQRYQFEVQLKSKRASRVGLLTDVQSSLRQELGREPTIEELHVDTGMDPREIARTLAELHGSSSGLTTEPDPFHTGRMTPQQVQTMRLVRLDLRPRERLIWDLKLGINGQPKTDSQRTIARKAGVSDATVSRTLARIERMVADYSGGTL